MDIFTAVPFLAQSTQLCTYRFDLHFNDLVIRAHYVFVHASTLGAIHVHFRGKNKYPFTMVERVRGRYSYIHTATWLFYEGKWVLFKMV